MRVLAFDPGYERLGVAVLEKENGKEKLLYSECIRTSSALPFSERLYKLGNESETLIKKWAPDVMALEQVFFEKNAKTAMQVAEVRGMLTYIAAIHKLIVLQYAPAAVKIAITGYGKSDKAAVAAMVMRLINTTTETKMRSKLDDEVDAIAVGITCLASLR